MKKSLCIKTNNKKILEYLFKNLSDINHIAISKNQFKIYKNVIIHYTNEPVDLATILSSVVIKFYEKRLLCRILNVNYFYFSDLEKKEILKTAISFLEVNRINDIFDSIYAYIIENKIISLDGFINFRLKSYFNILDNTIDLAVNKFLIDREYNEFIKLLSLYVNSRDNTTDIIHLIYISGNSILLDNEKNIIPLDDNIFNAKYLSDITFSSNDYALNAILSIIPEKLYIHLIDAEDEFVTTLKLIFSENAILCTDCNLCRTYKLVKDSYCLQT